MTSTVILSDNGVSSGSAGLKSQGGNDGSLAIQTTTAGGVATTAISIDTSQNVSVTNGISIQGLTVGKGAGAVSTNTAVGASALAGNSTGAGITAVGYGAATSTTASWNTAVGYTALNSSNSGVGNVAVGADVMNNNTTGICNTAIGSYDGTTLGALRTNTTGSYNIAVGTGALKSNTTASYNTAVGYQAGYSNNGSTGTQGWYNVFVGAKAGYSTTTAASCTYLGDEAGYSNSTGGNNTFLGQYSGFGTTGAQNTFVGTNAGYLVTSGAKNTILGSYSGNQGGLDIRTSNNFIVLSDGDGNPRLWYDSGTTLFSPSTYAGTTASAANLNIASNGAIQRSTSALKYKQDIRDVEDFDISALRPVRYKSKCEGDDQTKDYLGLIADEAAEAGFEELVTRGANGEVEGFQYERLTVVLLKKLQVLEAEVKALKGQA